MPLYLNTNIQTISRKKHWPYMHTLALYPNPKQVTVWGHLDKLAVSFSSFDIW